MRMKKIFTLLTMLILISGLVQAVGSAGKVIPIEDVPDHIKNDPNFNPIPVSAPSEEVLNNAVETVQPVITGQAANVNDVPPPAAAPSEPAPEPKSLFSRLLAWLFGR